MEQDGEKKLCSNCKHWIAENNYLMHTIHCQRNIVLCKICQEPVPKTEVESHVQETHSKVRCESCGKDLERGEVEDHKVNECSKRLTTCAYCELECPFDEMKDHIAYCGSRTEACPKCGQFIMHKERHLHDNLACSPPKPKPPAPEPYSDIVHDLNDDIMGFNPSIPYNIPMPEVLRPPGADLHDAIQRAMDSSSNLFTGQFQQDQPFEDVVRNLSSGLNIAFPNDQKMDNTMLPCEFCGKLFTEDDIILHQSGCQLQDASPSVSEIPKEDKSSNSFSLEETEDFDSVMVSCETCSDIFSTPINQIDETPPICSKCKAHPSSSRCEDRDPDKDYSFDDVKDVMTVCSFCGGLYPVIEVHIHESVCVKNNAAKEKNSTAELLTPEDEEQIDMLPCEFCDELYPAQNLAQHQAVCEKNPDEPLLADQLYPNNLKLNVHSGYDWKSPSSSRSSSPEEKLDNSLKEDVNVKSKLNYNSKVQKNAFLSPSSQARDSAKNSRCNEEAKDTSLSTSEPRAEAEPETMNNQRHSQRRAPDQISRRRRELPEVNNTSQNRSNVGRTGAVPKSKNSWK